MPPKGVLLINLGTPDSPKPADVRKYLREFLSDPRVLDMAPLARSLLLNLVILPFRPKKSGAAYEQIWTERGSPLLFHTQDLAAQLQKVLGETYTVEMAMRYQTPSIPSALASFVEKGVESIVAIPLFPQYSSAAWGSAAEHLFKEASKFWNIPAIELAPPFYDHPQYIAACAEIAHPILADFKPDKIMMSFHGLPERHCTKSDASGGQHCFKVDNCCASIVPANRFCYRAQCFATAGALAEKLSLTDEQYEVAFQSRLGRDPWIKPYTDFRLDDLPKEGVKRLAVCVPSFVADCLETLEEIGIRAKEQFVKAGGDDLVLIPAVNSSDTWVEACVSMVRTNGTPA